MPRLAAFVPRTLRHRGFRLLLCGRCAGDLGSEMLPVAMVGLVLVEHGPLMLGLVLGVRGAAGSLFALLTGALLTRMRKSTALVVNGSVQLLVMLGFALGPDAGPWLLALAALSGVSGSVVAPASGSLIPLIVYAVAGALAEMVGARTVLFWAAAVGLVTSLLPLLVPGVSRLADRPSPH